MLIAGVDEVGRGCLAGPVMAAAVVLKEPINGLCDSKKLSVKKRETLAKELMVQPTYDDVLCPVVTMVITVANNENSAGKQGFCLIE